MVIAVKTLACELPHQHHLPLARRSLSGLIEFEDRLLRFQAHDEQVARPFDWKFTRNDLIQLLSKLETSQGLQHQAA